MLWIDAFNPLNTKDSSLYLCVATIGALDSDHSGKRGYLIWLGPAKEDTDAVECRLVRELNHLLLGNTSDDISFYVYHKHPNRVVRVMLHPFVILCYQPDTAARTKNSSGGCFHLQFWNKHGFFLPWVKKYHAAHSVTRDFFHLHSRNLMIYKIVAVIFVLMQQEKKHPIRISNGSTLQNGSTIGHK